MLLIDKSVECGLFRSMIEDSLSHPQRHNILTVAAYRRLNAESLTLLLESCEQNSCDVKKLLSHRTKAGQNIFHCALALGQRTYDFEAIHVLLHYCIKHIPSELVDLLVERTNIDRVHNNCLELAMFSGDNKAVGPTVFIIIAAFFPCQEWFVQALPVENRGSETEYVLSKLAPGHFIEDLTRNYGNNGGYKACWKKCVMMYRERYGGSFMNQQDRTLLMFHSVD